MVNVFEFYYRNLYAKNGITLALQKMLKNKKPVVVCIGTDKINGDSLGPSTGTLLKYYNNTLPIIGSLSKPITAKEVPYLKEFIAHTFPNRIIIAIDAAVGTQEEVGLIRISDRSLIPGSGIQKNLTSIGDVSIQGIVAEKSMFLLDHLKTISLDMIQKMSEHICEGISGYYNNIC